MSLGGMEKQHRLSIEEIILGGLQFARSGNGFAVTLQSPQSACPMVSLRSRRLPASLSPAGVLLTALLGTGLFSLPAHAAESIAAHLDPNGRMVFVNEDPSVVPAASTPKKASPSKINSSVTKG